MKELKVGDYCFCESREQRIEVLTLLKERGYPIYDYLLDDMYSGDDYQRYPYILYDERHMINVGGSSDVGREMDNDIGVHGFKGTHKVYCGKGFRHSLI
jgi:hypothetical protein